ncbi:hypothetical protein FACS1894107_17060 [Planctomycetales bacterium]|nr:hypothetical protein FACS1894107_17060 [Planctomycetales bacterium]
MRNQYNVIAATMFSDRRAAERANERRLRLEKREAETLAALELAREQAREAERRRDEIERDTTTIIADCQYRREKAERDTAAEIALLQKKTEALREGFWLVQKQRQLRISLTIALALTSGAAGMLFGRFVV